VQEVATQLKARKVKEPVEPGPAEIKAKSTATKTKYTQPDVDESQTPSIPVRRGRKVITEAETSEDKAASTKPARKVRTPKSALSATADNVEDVEAEETAQKEPRQNPSRRTRTPKPEVQPEGSNETERPKSAGRKTRAKDVEDAADAAPSGRQTNKTKVVEDTANRNVDAPNVDDSAAKPIKKGRSRVAKEEPVKDDESQVQEGASKKTPASTKVTRATRVTKKGGLNPESSEDAIKTNNAPRAQSPVVAQEHKSGKVAKKDLAATKDVTPTETEIAPTELPTTKTRRGRARAGKA
jgi:hypothetical protein